MGGPAAAGPVRHDGRAGFTIVPLPCSDSPYHHVIMNLSRKYLLWWQVLRLTVRRLTSAMQLERYGGDYKILPRFFLFGGRKPWDFGRPLTQGAGKKFLGWRPSNQYEADTFGRRIPVLSARRLMSCGNRSRFL